MRIKHFINLTQIRHHHPVEAKPANLLMINDHDYGTIGQAYMSFVKDSASDSTTLYKALARSLDTTGFIYVINNPVGSALKPAALLCRTRSSNPCAGHSLSCVYHIRLYGTYGTGHSV